MNLAPHLDLTWADWLNLFGRYLFLSLLSIGGGITTVPDMHRYLVEQNRWLSDSQFTASISLAQAAPGPNILFVALMGWNVGVNTGSLAAGLLGVLVTMTGILLPSTILTYMAAQWGYRNRELRAVRAFKQGMAPMVVGLILSTAWILAGATREAATYWPLWLVSAVSIVIMYKTRIHLLWLLGAGALLGWFGFLG
jgi:chromate transporter